MNRLILQISHLWRLLELKKKKTTFIKYIKLDFSAE